MKVYRTLWPYFYRSRFRLLAGLAALIFCDFLQLMIPRVVKHAVDLISTLKADSSSLALAGLLIIAMAMAIGFFRYIWRILILGFSRLVEEDIRKRMFSKLLAFPQSWMQKRTTGDIMAHATNDLDALRMASGMGLVALVDSMVMGTASIGFMIWIDPTLTLLALIPMPLITILTSRLGSMMFKRHRRVQDIFGRMTGQVREYLSGIRVVQANVREDLVTREMDKIGRLYLKENVRLNFVSGAFFPLMLMFSNLSLTIVLYFGGRLTVFSQISPGDFVAFISYLGLLTWPMMALGWLANLVQRGAASLVRINTILDEEPEIKDPEQPAAPPFFKGELRIENLTFSYPNRKEEILQNLTLDGAPGGITAVVGRTGSGKTTVLNLILRIFDPPTGTVFLDGVDVREMNLADLRGAIGYVPQDGYIFSGTLSENIAFGSPDADEDRIMEAAREAGLEDDILSFSDGLNTYIGERGVTLSGGQKQRLALARAILIDPPLLILDDTFSAVDAKAEETILANICRIRAGKSTIMVSHRLTSLKVADKIWVIENGAISESGSHWDLIENGGYYSQLHQLQQVQAEYGQPEYPVIEPSERVN